MGVTKYKSNTGKALWKLDTWLTLPDGRLRRVRQSKIPTREMALVLEARLKAEAFEGKHFDRVKTVSVKKVWENYAEKAERDNRAWATDRGRAAHLLEHFGKITANALTEKHVEDYRKVRFRETTCRGSAPSSGTVDREIELLKRILNYAVRTKVLQTNPVAHVPLLNKPNTRKLTLDEKGFEKLLEAADEHIRPILVVAFDTGMRKEEILGLRWEQVDLAGGRIFLYEEDTKAQQARLILMTGRVLDTLEALPRALSGYVFINPKTGTRWNCIKKSWKSALKRAGLDGMWFHDMRRSFVSNSRRIGVQESVVMRMSGHKSRKVFDRYNIVSDDDLKQAVQLIEQSRQKEVSTEESKVVEA